MNHLNDAQIVYESYLAPILHKCLPAKWTHKGMKVGTTYAVLIMNTHGEIIRLLDVADCFVHLQNDDTVTAYWKSRLEDLHHCRTGDSIGRLACTDVKR